MSQEGEGTIATTGAEEGWALRGRWRECLRGRPGYREACCVLDRSPRGVRGQNAHRGPESVEGIVTSVPLFSEVDPF